MKLFLNLLLFVCLSTFAGGVKEITVDELNQNLKSKNTSYVLLDVRTPFEYSSIGIIKGAVKKNAYDSDMVEYVKKLDPKKTYLVYCHSGVRSKRVVELMSKHKITGLNVKGGISAWKSKGYPVK